MESVDGTAEWREEPRETACNRLQKRYSGNVFFGGHRSFSRMAPFRVLEAARAVADEVNALLRDRKLRLIHRTQLRNSAQSIPANIREGMGRKPGPDRRRSYGFARGSAEETAEHLRANFADGRVPAVAYWRIHNRIALVRENPEWPHDLITPFHVLLHIHFHSSFHVALHERNVKGGVKGGVKTRVKNGVNKYVTRREINHALPRFVHGRFHCPFHVALHDRA